MFGCANVNLIILFQRFLEARVVRSESDGSFTLTLSVPELERAFGKKFKSKTKYKTEREQLLALRHFGARPFPPANLTWFLSRPPESSAATVTLPPVVLSLSSPGSSAVSVGCTVSLEPVHPLSGTIWHLVPSPPGGRHLLSFLPVIFSLRAAVPIQNASFSSFALIKATIVDLLCSGFS